MATKFRWISLLVMGVSLVVAGGLVWGFQGSQREPMKVDASRVSSLPDGTWVEVQGTIDVESLVGTQGLLLRGKLHAFQLEEDKGGMIVLTSTARHPAFGELVGDALGFLLEPSRVPSAGKSLSPFAVAFFTKPQTWTGVLDSTSEFGSGEVELEKEKFKIKGFNSYCLTKGVHCSPSPRVLLAGTTPKTGLALVLQSLVAVLVAAVAAFGAIKAKTLGPAWAEAWAEVGKEASMKRAASAATRGARVVVFAPDGNRYPAIVVDVQQGSCLCTMPNGQNHWFPANLIAPG